MITDNELLTTNQSETSLFSSTNDDNDNVLIANQPTTILSSIENIDDEIIETHRYSNSFMSTVNSIDYSSATYTQHVINSFKISAYEMNKLIHGEHMSDNVSHYEMLYLHFYKYLNFYILLCD